MSELHDPIVIAAATRTAIGSFQGHLSSLSAPELGGAAIKAGIEQASIKPDHIDELLMGCVLPAGMGQAPARQAGFLGGLSKSIPATTLNKMCGSGMRTVMMAYDQLLVGNGEIIIAGGLESMSNAPYLLPKMRDGARIGHDRVMDHMFLDGLEDAYDKGQLMGDFAENCVEKYQFSREEQDDYALQSLDRATTAQRDGIFNAEITPITVEARKSEHIVEQDEQPQNARPDKIPHLKPAFKKDGTITAANASSISDGAAALIVMKESTAQKHGYPIRAYIRGHASHAHAPRWFTTAPVPAAQKLLQKLGWSTASVDLWEVNEAFAVVPMAFMKELEITHDIVNIYGGACALGHPVGASGARIMVTLLNALRQQGKKRGVAAICIGGGEGSAIAIERVD